MSRDDELEPAYLIEDHGDGHATILVPWAQTSFAGHVKLLNETGLI